MIAIDVGCSPQGGNSIRHIIRENRPDQLYGFDPSPAVKPIVGVSEVEGVPVEVWRMAAWHENVNLYWVPHGYGYVSTTPEQNSIPIQAFDLADFIAERPADEKILLKLDCEGAEYKILPHLLERGLGDRLEALWIEWHYNVEGAEEIEAQVREILTCPIWNWNM